MAAAAILDFRKIAYLAYGVNNGGRHHLGFLKFFFFINHRVPTVFLRIAVKFGDDQSTQSKVASIFRNFCFGLNFPFEGLFGEVFGGRRPPKVISYNSNPQKAQLAAERRHMAH